MFDFEKHFAPKNKGFVNGDFLGRAVKASDYSRVYKNSAIISLEDAPPIVYLNIDASEYDYLRSRFEKLDFPKSTRKAIGNNNKSLLVGAISAVQNHDRHCSYAPLLDYDPLLSAFICDVLSSHIGDIFKILLPDAEVTGQKAFTASGIHEDYRLKDTSLTSAVINKNSPHFFHVDDSNLENCYSAMVTLKKDVKGGYLCFPEYDMAVEVSDGSLIFFYGKGIMHGVSNITYMNKDAYRYSLVYYAVKGLMRCGSIKQEYLKA